MKVFYCLLIGSGYYFQLITSEGPIFPASWLTGTDHESQRYTKVAHKANSILLYQVRCITLVSGLER